MKMESCLSYVNWPKTQLRRKHVSGVSKSRGLRDVETMTGTRRPAHQGGLSSGRQAEAEPA